MENIKELEMLYNIVVARSNPADNPRYEQLKAKQNIMENKIISAVKEGNSEFSQFDYEDEILKYIVDWSEEYCLNAFAKGVAFALNFKEQAEQFANKDEYNI